VAALRRLLFAIACALALAACAGDASPVGPPAAGPATSAVSPSPPATPGAPDRGGDVSVPPAGSPPQTGHPWFLTVGDSITSGYTVDPARTGTNSTWALGLEQLLAQRGTPWSLYDVACSGETLASYRTRCHDRIVSTAVLQGRSQERTALDAIAAHGADLKLIVVDLGSNDLLHTLESGGSPQSAASTVRTQLTAVVAELQQAAPGVPVILCNYYNPLENIDPPSEAQLAQVNAVVAQIATERGARLADFHSAINTAPAPNPQLCAYVDCAHIDVHPTVAGHARLAQAALAAVG
jgi:lysophospholipase L1-like esterase